MNTNKNLKIFYDKVYSKGEKKHYSNFVVMDSPSEVDNAILNEIKWKGKKVIDVGCGTGLFAFHVAKKGAKVLGIDYSDEAINEATQKYKHPNLTYKKFDVSKKLPEKYAGYCFVEN